MGSLPCTSETLVIIGGQTYAKIKMKSFLVLYSFPKLPYFIPDILSVIFCKN